MVIKFLKKWLLFNNLEGLLIDTVGATAMRGFSQELTFAP